MKLKVAKRGEWGLLKFMSCRVMILLQAQYFHIDIVKFILSEAEGSHLCTLVHMATAQSYTSC